MIASILGYSVPLMKQSGFFKTFVAIYGTECCAGALMPWHVYTFLMVLGVKLSLWLNC